MAQKLQYSPLLNDDIRVIQLLTQVDDPVHATGPVHCKLVHVSLDDSHRVDSSKTALKGSDGVWPVTVANAVDNESGTSQPVNYGALFEAGLAERMIPFARLPETPYFERPNFLKAKAKSQHRAPAWDPSKDPEADLPWRYTWGDFVALSYVWGDQSIRKDIYVNGVPMSVTASLESALRELRNHMRIQQGFYVWVDALCINQEDMDERGVQVGRMKEIYHTAWHVVIWLGPEAHRSDLAMLALRYMSVESERGDVLSKLYKRVEFYIVRLPYMQWKHEHRSLLIRKGVLNAIHHLLSRPYWRRLWIIQEVVLGSTNSPVLCGGSSILIRDIFKSLQVMKGDGDALGQYIIMSARGNSTLGRKWNITEDTYEISEKLWERPVAMAILQALDTNLATTNRGVYDALLLSREAKATDERDRVYGILGLPHLARLVKINPDYNLTAAQTFTMFSARLLSSGNLNGLRLVNSPVPPIGTQYLKSTHFSRPRKPRLVHGHRTIHRGCEHGLPSWVICWSCPRNPAQPFDNRSSALSPLTSPSLPSSAPPRITDDRLLTAQGVIFEEITSLSACHATESSKTYPLSSSSPPPSPYGTRTQTREALARLFTGNDPAGSDPSLLLLPRLWQTGIMGVDTTNVFGVKDFYYRNRSLRLWDAWTIDTLIREPKGALDKRVRAGASTAPKLARLTPGHHDVMAAAMRMLAWRRLVTTRSGYMGLVPAATRAGDVIAVLVGCDAPLVLRPESEGRYSVVGEAREAQVNARLESTSKNLEALLERKNILEHPPNYEELRYTDVEEQLRKIREEISKLVKKKRALRTELAELRKNK
ncbi:HET-domain-containing protein [Annulohypoxylon truncatum]|uniref:HET-domain-containing protein n=1 Tax=Annulohypoxylon truncatum TaxID=327061 RepID=UPI0020085373|nr:HET-domain-containing protein [Annulohypoxylon truncatum]KAI1213837.1 HET-domain-containing protein [Annulohypoxylon truncatum]